MQFKSSNRKRSQNDPIWMANVRNTRTGDIMPELVWWHRSLEGPHEGMSGYRGFLANMTLPVGRWFQLTARVRQSADFDGAFQLWLDGRLLFDMDDVRTGHRDCTYNAWCTDQGWSVNSYSDGLSPTPSVIYVDDVRIGWLQSESSPLSPSASASPEMVVGPAAPDRPAAPVEDGSTPEG